MFAEINGEKLYYEIEGTGTPCLVPSLAGFPIYQRTFSKKLRKSFQFVFVDMRACGHSTGAAEDISFDTLSDDLDQFRQKLGFETTAILGHSAHGILALEYSARYQPQTSHVIVIGSPPIWTSEILSQNQAYWESTAFCLQQRFCLA